MFFGGTISQRMSVPLEDMSNWTSWNIILTLSIGTNEKCGMPLRRRYRMKRLNAGFSPP